MRSFTQGAGDFDSYGHTAAGQGQDEHVRAGFVGSQPLGKLASRLGPVGEPSVHNAPPQLYSPAANGPG